MTHGTTPHRHPALAGDLALLDPARIARWNALLAQVRRRVGVDEQPPRQALDERRVLRE